jgi:hypothetical protein
MTNINFLKSDILINSIEWDIPTPAFPTQNWNLKTGSRSSLWARAGAAINLHEFEFYSDVENYADTLILLGAKIPDLDLKVHTLYWDGSGWITFFYETLTATGVSNSDYLKSFTGASAEKFRITLEYQLSGSTQNTLPCLQKILLGQKFSLNVEPSEFEIEIKNSNRNIFQSVDGLKIVNYEFPSYIFEFNFKLISDTDLNNFLEKVNVNSDQYLAVFCETNDKLFNEKNLIYGKIQNIKFRKIYKNLNELSFELVES